MGNLSSKGNVSLMEEESFYSRRGLFVAGKNVQPFAVAMASSHAMEFVAARCRVAVAASKLSSTDVAAINVLSGNIINTTTTRKIHATTARHYAEDYIHAEHMYNLPSMKQRKLKMFIAVFGSLFFGAAVPIWAVRFQLKKSGSGPTLDTKSTTEDPDKLT